MNEIQKSLRILTENSAVAAKAGVKKLAGRAAAKILPGVGTALSWSDAYDRWQKGDRSGAVISALAGGAFLVPGLGAVAGTALDAANIGRDIKAGDYDELGQTIKDKISGKNTTESNMKESERIAQLRDRLDQINEGPLSWLKNIGKGAKGGKTPPPPGPGGAAKVDPSMYPPPAVKPNTAVGAAKTPPKTDPNVIDVDAKVVKPGMSTGQKAAVGAGAAALAGTAGYMAGKDTTGGASANPPAKTGGATQATPGQSPAQQGKPAAGSALSAEETSELDALAAELEAEMGRLPELDALLLRHTKLKGGQ